jgi:DNA-binding response OmpR family regulator
LEPKRVLVVEDESAVRHMYRTALTFAGFDVDVAADGLMALQKIEEARPDLVVLDLDLPRVDGRAVLADLRAHSETWSIPVVIVTGTDHPYAVTAGTTILRKPCAIDDLVTVIESHLALIV